MGIVHGRDSRGHHMSYSLGYVPYVRHLLMVRRILVTSFVLLRIISDSPTKNFIYAWNFVPCYLCFIYFHFISFVIKVLFSVIKKVSGEQVPEVSFTWWASVYLNNCRSTRSSVVLLVQRRLVIVWISFMNSGREISRVPPEIDFLFYMLQLSTIQCHINSKIFSWVVSLDDAADVH